MLASASNGLRALYGLTSVQLGFAAVIAEMQVSGQYDGQELLQQDENQADNGEEAGNIIVERIWTEFGKGSQYRLGETEGAEVISHLENDQARKHQLRYPASRCYPPKMSANINRQQEKD